ncbi:MAG TPA: leucine--tRNA ligase, partial [Limnochordia bacterium]|nr:leucine--tRNA ligase [Limnochordia bacterium]
MSNEVKTARRSEEARQVAWRTAALHAVDRHPDRPKLYVLEMFPYPSGRLHVGHLRNYTIGDTLARCARMRGFNVLHPMGWDAFGLPAENAAIKRGAAPAAWTFENIAYMREQADRMGLSYDWSREVTTCSPDYYRWTQWLFIRLYERGLAYKKRQAVNWCPSCNTVLANEQVVAGLCERCDTPVTKRDLEQWFFKITDYAQRLLDGLDELEWPEFVKLQQRNWIGRSEGVVIEFDVADRAERLSVFTTRPDTLYGATYMVVAPEHPQVADWIADSPERAEIEAFIETARRTDEIERTAEDREKRGVFTGAYALNPVNGKRIPIWISDYVLMGYGTGAIMAVPAHDERDFAFARKYELPIIPVISPDGRVPESLAEAYVGEGVMIHSGELDGLSNQAAWERIADQLEAAGRGKRQVQYRLRDWLISRQRYWGTPIPMLYCDRCGVV